MTNIPPLWEHQRAHLGKHINDRVHYIGDEQRCGKSRKAIETAAHQYVRGRIDAILVVAWPSGVHINWISNEFANYLPQAKCLAWNSSKSKTVKFNNQFDDLIAHKGLIVLSVNADAIVGQTCRTILGRFLKARKVFLIVDEADWASSVKALRTKSIIAISRHPNVLFKRCLSGTMATEHPLQIFSQFAILDPNILGFNNFYSFRARYAEMEETKLYTAGGLRRFAQVKGYRNLDELKNKIAPYYSRTTRAEISDAPPKVYQKRIYELSEIQRKFYNDLKKTFQAELVSGRMITAAHVLQRYTLLQQVLSNRVPEREEAEQCLICNGDGCDGCDQIGVRLTTIPQEIIDPSNDSRLETLLLDLDPSVPTIIWCRFIYEIDVIAAKLYPDYAVVRIDGSISAEERYVNLSSFQRGTSNILIGTAAAGGRGLRADKAELVIFYSNSFSLRQRLHAEDRAEAIDRKISTGVIDLVAMDTIDEYIISALRSKLELSKVLTSDLIKAIS